MPSPDKSQVRCSQIMRANGSTSSKQGHRFINSCPASTSGAFEAPALRKFQQKSFFFFVQMQSVRSIRDQVLIPTGQSRPSPKIQSSNNQYSSRELVSRLSTFDTKFNYFHLNQRKSTSALRNEYEIFRAVMVWEQELKDKEIHIRFHFKHICLRVSA